MIDIVWDEKTRTLIEKGGLYGRMIRLRRSRHILCVFERAGKSWSRHSRDNGATWGQVILAAQSAFGNAAVPGLQAAIEYALPDRLRSRQQHPRTV